MCVLHTFCKANNSRAHRSVSQESLSLSLTNYRHCLTLLIGQQKGPLACIILAPIISPDVFGPSGGIIYNHVKMATKMMSACVGHLLVLSTDDDNEKITVITLRLIYIQIQHLRVTKLHFKQNAIARTTHDILQAAICNRTKCTSTYTVHHCIHK